MPQVDFFGKIDPYYQVFYHDTKLYQSETVKNADHTFAWKEAKFNIPSKAIFKELIIKVWDKDTFSKDDLLFSVEIRYPFRCNSYTLGNTGAILKVLDDDGHSDSSLTEGSLDSSDNEAEFNGLSKEDKQKHLKKKRAAQKKNKKDAKFFKVLDLGNLGKYADQVKEKVEDAAVKVGIKKKEPTLMEKLTKCCRNKSGNDSD